MSPNIRIYGVILQPINDDITFFDSATVISFQIYFRLIENYEWVKEQIKTTQIFT